MNKRLRSFYHKFLEEIKRIKKIPHYDYEKVLKQIQHASYPASLGMINLGLYQYVKSTKTLNANPEIFFLISSFLFFFISIMIGLGIDIAIEDSPFTSDERKEMRYRQAYIIIIAFSIAIVFDFLGLAFLLAL